MRVVLVGSERDVHLARVHQELDRLGVASKIVDMETLGDSADIEIRQLGTGRPTARLVGKEWEISTDEIGVLWLRRPHLPAISAQVSDPADRFFARNEWRVAIDALANSVPKHRVFNPPACERAASKPRQLQRAVELGFRVPDTLITSSPDAARAFLEKHDGKVIHKTLTAPPHAFVETRPLAADDLTLLELLPLAPTMLQEQVNGVADLRITIVGDRHYAARIPSRPGGALDSRLDLSQAYQACDVEPDLAARLKRLLEILGLPVGTVDLKLRESGECVFFEINPQGQFLYVEIMTGQEIAKGFAQTFAGIASRPV